MSPSIGGKKLIWNKPAGCPRAKSSRYRVGRARRRPSPTNLHLCASASRPWRCGCRGWTPPFDLPLTGLTQLAGHLADPANAELVVKVARQAVAGLFEKLLPAIQKPMWDDNFWEEYFVFHFPPG